MSCLVLSVCLAEGNDKCKSSHALIACHCARAGFAEGQPSHHELRLEKAQCRHHAAGMGDEVPLQKLDTAQLQAGGAAALLLEKKVAYGDDVL